MLSQVAEERGESSSYKESTLTESFITGPLREEAAFGMTEEVTPRTVRILWFISSQLYLVRVDLSHMNSSQH